MNAAKQPPLPGELLSLLLLLAGLIVPEMASGQSDDFNDGNDTTPPPAWVRYDPIGSHPALPDQATYSFTNGGYRIQTRPSPDPAMLGPGRAGSLRTETNYSNFYVSVDIVDWNENVNQAFGIIARVREPGLGATDGYAFTYDFGGGDIDITRFINENTATGAGGGNVGSGPDTATLVKGRVYRMVAIGKGAELTFRLYELPDTVNPIASVSGIDVSSFGTVLTNGMIGLLIYDNSNQTLGGISPDITFDNYSAQDIEPPRISILRGSFGDILVSWPVDPPAFILQSTPGFSPIIDWTDITENITVSTDGLRNEYNDTSSNGGNKFYRLKRP